MQSPMIGYHCRYYNHRVLILCWAAVSTVFLENRAWEKYTRIIAQACAGPPMTGVGGGAWPRAGPPMQHPPHVAPM